MQVYEWSTEIADSIPTPTPAPTPGPGMKIYGDIEPYEIEETEGPLESSARILLVNKNWYFKTSDTRECLCINIDEIDFVGNIKKTIYSFTSEELSPDKYYRITFDIQNDADFSQRYEIGDKLYLAISIWGETTESKPSPPYTSIMHGSEVRVWSVDIVSEIPPPVQSSDMKFHKIIDKHIVRKLVGPLVPEDLHVFVNTPIYLMNKGLRYDFVCIDLDEINSDGSFIKTLDSFIAGRYLDKQSVDMVYGDWKDYLGLSRRYEIGERIYLSMTTWGYNFERKIQRFADVKFEDDIAYHELKELKGPIDKTSRDILLLRNGWSFLFNGMNPEIVRIDIDEIDIESNFLKTLASYETTEIISYGKYKMNEDIYNTEDFSKRYEIGDTLFLAAFIWGKDTETKSAIPPTSPINIKQWSYKII